MVLLEKLWDDVIAGPHPENGLGKLRGKASAKNLAIDKGDLGESSGKLYLRSQSMPKTPTTPTSPATASIWRSVFHPGSNINTKTIGADLFDRPHPNSPTVYDWMYSGESRSEYR